jgi:hypothetical protein
LRRLERAYGGATIRQLYAELAAKPVQAIG